MVGLKPDLLFLDTFLYLENRISQEKGSLLPPCPSLNMMNLLNNTALHNNVVRLVFLNKKETCLQSCILPVSNLFIYYIVRVLVREHKTI